MKIGIEVQRLFRKQKFGIEVAALQLIKNLQQHFKETEFVIYVKPDVDDKCLKESENLSIKKINGKVFFDFEHITLPLAAKSDQIDLLHCTGNTTPFFSTVPIVQTLHDVIFMDPISKSDTLYQQFGNRYRRMMVPLVTPKSDMVITVSNYEKDRILKRIDVDESKVRVIYNGIDESRFHINDDPRNLATIRKRYNLPKNFILFLGNTAARKNSLRVIEAYCAYASKTTEPLPIVTPGLPEKFIADHLSSLNEIQKKKNFITPGYVEDDHLATLYSLSNFFLYPSLSEGFGMPLVEAMACGTPVITSNTTCLPEIAGNAALLVNPENTTAIADAITRMATDETLRMNKIALGVMNARRFSWKKTAEQVFDVYEEVLSDKTKIIQPLVSVSY
jgi:glycosyltransferase involved in cell wall biosynthesis